MTRFSLLLLAVLSLGVVNTVRDAQAQNQGAEIQVAARGISYVREKFERGGVFSPGAVVVIDPMLINEELVEQKVELPERASQIARLVRAQVGSLHQHLTCADTIPGDCRMSAAIVFRVSQPTIQGDTAKVHVMYWWHAPHFRYATPSAGVELTLVRSGGQWTVVNERRLTIS